MARTPPSCRPPYRPARPPPRCPPLCPTRAPPRCPVRPRFGSGPSGIRPIRESFGRVTIPTVVQGASLGRTTCAPDFCRGGRYAVRFRPASRRVCPVRLDLPASVWRVDRDVLPDDARPTAERLAPDRYVCLVENDDLPERVDGRTCRLGFEALRVRTLGRVIRVRAGFRVTLRLPRRTLRDGVRLWLRLRTLRDDLLLRRARIFARELCDLTWLLPRATDRRVVLRAERFVDRRVTDPLDRPTERELRALVLPLLPDLERLLPRETPRWLDRADERRAVLRPFPRPSGPAKDSAAGTPVRSTRMAMKTLQRPNSVLPFPAMTCPPDPE